MEEDDACSTASASSASTASNSSGTLSQGSSENQQQLELRRQQQEMQLQQQINAILSLTAESARADDHLIYGPRAVLPWANPENVEQARQDFSNSARAMVLLTLSHYRAKRQRDAAAATQPRQPLAPLIETSDESAASTAASKEQSQPEEQHGLRMQTREEVIFEMKLLALDCLNQQRRGVLEKVQQASLVKARTVHKESLDALATAQAKQLRDLIEMLTKVALLEVVALPAPLRPFRFRPSNDLAALREQAQQATAEATAQATAEQEKWKRKVFEKEVEELTQWQTRFMHNAFGKDPNSIVSQLLQRNKVLHDKCVYRTSKQLSFLEQAHKHEKSQLEDSLRLARTRAIDEWQMQVAPLQQAESSPRSSGNSGDSAGEV